MGFSSLAREPGARERFATSALRRKPLRVSWQSAAPISGRSAHGRPLPPCRRSCYAFRFGIIRGSSLVFSVRVCGDDHPYITRFVPSTRPMTPCELSPSVTAADLAWRRPAGRPRWLLTRRVSRRRARTHPEHRRTAPKVIAAWRGRAVVGGRRRARFAIRSAAVQQWPSAWCGGSAAFLGRIALFADDIRLVEPGQRCVHDLACATQRSGPGWRCHGDHRTPPDAVRPARERRTRLHRRPAMGA